jgi:hypothetical protein
MEKQKSYSSNDIEATQVIHSLHAVRDELVLLSCAMQDLLFVMDAQLRLTAKESTDTLLDRIKKSNLY